MSNTQLSYAIDIRPLFREFDITAMIKARGLDLSDYEQVKARAGDILERLAAGDMPCDQAWPEKDIETFRLWIDGGKLP